MTIKWRRSWFPVWYAFCPTQLDWDKAMRQCDSPIPYPDYQAACTAYDDKEGDHCVLVTMSYDWRKDPATATGLLVHECVHVVQWVSHFMIDDKPSWEFQAYATQAVFCELHADISEYLQSTGALPAS